MRAGRLTQLLQPHQVQCGVVAGTHVCRVTNLNEEKQKAPTNVRITQQFVRDGQPLRNELMVDMFEGVRDETISHEDMEYWFRDNPDDIEEEKFLDTLEEIPNKDFTVRNDAWDSVCPTCCHGFNANEQNMTEILIFITFSIELDRN